MKVLIIHNPERYERYPRLINELKTQGIENYEIVPAVWDVRGVEHGINRAHKNCIQYAKDNRLNEIMVLEDDARFCGEGAFQYFINNIPLQYDLYLGSVYLGEILEDNTVRSFSGMGCYICHSKFYDTFLSVPDDQHIDRIMEGRGKFYVSNPFTCIQYNGFSQTARTDMNYDFLLQNRKFYGNFTL